MSKPNEKSEKNTPRDPLNNNNNVNFPTNILSNK